ncbi:retrotransposon protein, putative, ty1-copia subclass [Tanacetum coccineum]
MKHRCAKKSKSSITYSRYILISLLNTLWDWIQDYDKNTMMIGSFELEREGEGKITTWEELVEKFFCKFYPESYDGEEEMLDEGNNWGIDPLEFISRVKSSFGNHGRVDGRSKKNTTAKDDERRQTKHKCKDANLEANNTSNTLNNERPNKRMCNAERTSMQKEIDEVGEVSIIWNLMCDCSHDDTSPSENTSEIPMKVEGFEPPHEEEAPIRRSIRTHRAPERLCLNVEVEEHSLGDLNEPANYKAAMLDPESNTWLNAMNAKMQSMKDNQVWRLVDLHPDCKIVGSKWLFKKKTDMDGNVHTYKARLVAKGFTQLYGVDYEETFSPVADIRAIRILIAITAFYDYDI